MSFLAWGFAIAGAVGASIPLIIHLLNRERARRLIFSTVRFIQMSHQTNVQRHKLKRLLLLLMRILILILLGLAFARPYFAADPETAPELGGTRNAVIILDTSYSMQYEDVFDRAKKEAIARLDGLENTDAVGLILSADKALTVLPLDTERSHIRSTLSNAKPTYHKTDYLDAIQTASQLLEQVAVGQKQIYLVADLQKNGWDNFLDTDRLSPNIDIEFVNVGVEQSDNLAITGINVPPIVLVGGGSQLRPVESAELVARIHNFGTELVEDVSVKLSIDGKSVGVTQVDIEPGDITDAVFKLEMDKFQSGEMHTGWVDIGTKDSLGVDNRRYFTVQSLRTIKVHCINGEPKEPDYESETFFLRMALNAGREATPIDFTQSTALPSGADALQRYDVLILANLGEVTAADAVRLKEYVADGGGLIITLGDQVDATVYQQHLGASETPLMPCTLMQTVGDAIAREEFKVIATVDYKHPIFAPFRNPNHGDFGKGRFYRYFQATPTVDAAVIAAYDDGNPALFEKIYGNGRVLCFTSTLDREWNDLPVHAVYLPFLHEAIKHLALRQVSETAEYRVGEAVEYSPAVRSQSPGPGKTVAVFNPNREETRMTLSEQGQLFYENTELPGIYSVHRTGETAYYFVVNVDTTESDLTPRDAEELRSMLVGSTEVDRAPTELTDEVRQEYNEGVEKKQGIATYLLLAVFALAAAEMFIANRV